MVLKVFKYGSVKVILNILCDWMEWMQDEVRN